MAETIRSGLIQCSNPLNDESRPVAEICEAVGADSMAGGMAIRDLVFLLVDFVGGHCPVEKDYL